MRSLIRDWFPKSRPLEGALCSSRFSSRRLTLLYRFLNNCAMQSFKIPSILLYDHDGNFRGPKGTVGDDEAENLHQVRW